MNSTPESGNQTAKFQKVFLITAAVGLTPIALSYGVTPGTSLSSMFDLSISSVNGTHIFRAVMGLYLALATLWIMGTRYEKLTQPALISLIVFMFGLAGGRLLSFVVDGPAHWILSVYLLLELGFGLVGIILLKNRKEYCLSSS